jgi:hypothetical protein
MASDFISNKQNESRGTNLVFVLQKELAMSDEGFVTHFFLGKARIIEITPFQAKELVDHYESEFGSCYPFKGRIELHTLSIASRGIYRRFLRYIKLALKGYMLEQQQCPQLPALIEKVDNEEGQDNIEDKPVAENSKDPKEDEEQKKYDSTPPPFPSRSSPLEPCIDSAMIKRTLDSDDIVADWRWISGEFSTTLGTRVLPPD